MAVSESGTVAPLQGVSQQIPRERLPGQVTAQENMLSDPVTNIRRRPGAGFRYAIEAAGAGADSLLAWFVDIAGSTLHILLNSTNGDITILDKTYSEVGTLAAGSYLTAANRKDIRGAVVGDEFFLLNTQKQPALVAPAASVSPDSRGMFYIVAGSFNRTFEVVVTTSVGTISASYTTPIGSGGGDAALSTPSYIAGQLAASLDAVKATAGLSTVAVTEAYVYVEGSVGTTGVRVTSSTGPTFLTPSKDSYLTTEGNLPAKLPSAADGYIMRVGDVRLPKYYQYVHSTNSWLEYGAYGSPASISNMPISIKKSGASWVLDTSNFEGRFAGDDQSNPTPRFVEFGISGMSAYQSRLVLLSGPQVCLGGSTKARRFYRSTVAALIDSDPIQIGSSSNTSATYEYAVPFQKDLLLFSEKSQALMPSGNAAITPRTAAVVPTSTYTADMSSNPVTLGRTLMYPAPRSEDFFGVLEMSPSGTVDSQYISSDSTAHIPKYMAGRCRFSVSSTVANMVLMAPSKNKKSIIVHEYQWDGDKKVQQAWHTWTFPYDIASAYFSGDTLHIVMINNGYAVGCAIDPAAGAVAETGIRRPFLDLYDVATIADRVVTVPAWALLFDPDIEPRLTLVVASGATSGELVGSTAGDGVLNTVRSYPSGDVLFGIRYTSAWAPTPPLYRDYKDNVVSTNKLTLVRWIVGTEDSGEYQVSIKDDAMDEALVLDSATLYWSSVELDLGRDSLAEGSSAIVPCRTDAHTTTTVFSTNGVSEMNMVSLDHVLHTQQRIRRR